MPNVSIDWEAVAKVGVPAVIALFLVWRLSNGFELLGDELKLRAADHVQIGRQLESVANITGQNDMAQQQILYVLQTLCVNQARTDGQRGDCLRTPAGPRIP